MTSATRRPLSLQARSLLAAGIALAAFLGSPACARRGIYETLRTALHDRLQSYAYGYIASSEVSRARRWLPPEVSPDPRFDRPGSGLYAGVVAPVEVDGSKQDNWRSPSALGVDLPFSVVLEPNIAQFELRDSPAGKVYVFSMGVRFWDPANRGSVDLTLHIAEDTANLRAQLECSGARCCWSTSAASAYCCWRCCWPRCDGACVRCAASPATSRASNAATRTACRTAIRSNCRAWPPTSTISSRASATISRVIATRCPTSPTA
jgi:hypothetical protein